MRYNYYAERDSIVSLLLEFPDWVPGMLGTIAPKLARTILLRIENPIATLP